MGMSTVTYCGRQFAAPDGLLEIWLHAVADEIGHSANATTWLEELREDWHDQATLGFGFGIVPNLDKWAADKPRIDIIRELFQAVLNRFKPPGSVFSGTQRDSLGLGGGQSAVGATGSYDINDVAALGQRFIDLLSGG